ncbi:Tetratricopeptide repeat-containing protein [Formivibrio citricus]|uniref:Tetratricopeptide repeat-containing protein n=1 Tax=Formivibrio citricus TaxID=83765 RepID=A0A1I5BEN7_9NEIS|nr:CHAT domain-containing tetratricopeptide repeat protein [Formivibrio citricus]SFN73117.1 Tetratricopeptide repeat-containing protein [Formivibrio citricus]
MTPQTRLARLALTVALCFAAPVLRAETAPLPADEKTLRDAVSKAWDAKDWPQALRHVELLLKIHPEDAKLIRWKGNFLGESGRLKEAISAYRRSIELAPDDHAAWNGLCWRQIQSQQPLEARPACERSVSLKKDYANTVNLGHTYLLSGDTENAYRWYRETLGLIESEKELKEGPLADFDLFIQKSWQVEESRKARLWMAQSYDPARDKAQQLYDQYIKLEQAGKYAAAAEVLREQLAIRERFLAPEHPSTATSINNLAALYRAMGQYAQALPLYQRALVIAEKSQGPDHPRTATSLNNLALLYDNMGQYAQALPLYQRALAIAEKTLGPDHSNTGTYLNNLAELYRAMGQYAQALPLYQRALVIAEKSQGPDHPNTGTHLNNLAALYRAMGQYAQALPLYQRALVIAEKSQGLDHPRTATSLNDLALLYDNMGQYAQALPLYQRAHAIAKKTLGPDHPRTGTSLNNLAQLYSHMGQYAQALPLYQRALAIAEKSLGPDHPDTGTSLNNLAGLYSDMGNNDKALPLYQRALTIAEKAQGPDHPSTATLTKNLALLHWEMAHPDLALPLYERYVAIIEKLRSQSGLGVENKQNLFAQYVSGYKKYAQILGEQKQPEKAFHLFELSKARTLLEETAARAGRLALPEADAVQLENLQRQLAILNDKVAKADNDSQRMALLGERDQVERDLGILHSKLLQQFPKYAQLTTPTILEATEAAKLLPSDALFVSFLENGGKILALTMSSDGVVTYHDLGNPAGLNQAVATYRAIIAQPEGLAGLAKLGQRAVKLANGQYALVSTAEALPEGAKKISDVSELQDWLGQQLLVPIQDKLAGKRQWIISPDGALALLPFDTLRFAGEPVLKQHDVSLAQSLSIYALLRQRADEYRHLARAKTVFGMGNPDFGAAPVNQATPALQANTDAGKMAEQIHRGLRSGNSEAVRQGYAALRSTRWIPLPGTVAELEGVRKTFGANQTDLYLADQATELNLQSLNRAGKLADYRYLLFSTHGYLSTEVPALSSVVLGQKAVTPQADGYVTAAEWPGYSLKSDLVVLSACETGVGKSIQGEGVMGLPFALYVAGNVNTVLTLWQVDDEATSEFMRRFFARLKNGEDQIKALNAVKREFINSQDGLDNPAYWAPFVLYGV